MDYSDNQVDQVVSMFFTKDSESKQHLEDISDKLLDLIDELNNRLTYFDLPPPVEYIYNSTIYARHTFEMYVRKYCNTEKSVMYFGMNPGPWGMSQTGVPFGDVNSVKTWLGIEGPVGKPPREASTRPVKGFNCERSEVSGRRFWGLLKEICGTPEVFFKTSFIYNYLPQQWLKENGCNITPGDFKISEMRKLYDICDPIFCKVLELFKVKTVIAVGKFCEWRAKKSIEHHLSSNDVKVYYLPHPSPRSVNNNDWPMKAKECLKNFGILELYQNGDEEILLNT